MTTKRKTALELAQEHWVWLQSVLEVDRQLQRKLFIDAFVHGYKHGKEIK